MSGSGRPTAARLPSPRRCPPPSCGQPWLPTPPPRLPAEWVRACTADGRLTVVPMPVMVGAEIYGEGEDDIAATIAVALASGHARQDLAALAGAVRTGLSCGAEARLRVRRIRSIFPVSSPAPQTPPASRPPASASRWRWWTHAPWEWRRAWACRARWSPRLTAGTPRRSGPSREERLARTRVYFYVPSLEQLRRGGRIGAAASLWGTMFAIKPILAVEDGKIVPLEKVRSAARAIARLEEIVAADASARPARPGPARRPPFRQPGRSRPACAHGLRPCCPSTPPAQISALPAVLAAHAGLGVLAVIVGESSTPLNGGSSPGCVRRCRRCAVGAGGGVASLPQDAGAPGTQLGGG